MVSVGGVRVAGHRRPTPMPRQNVTRTMENLPGRRPAAKASPIGLTDTPTRRVPPWLRAGDRYPSERGLERKKPSVAAAPRIAPPTGKTGHERGAR